MKKVLKTLMLILSLTSIFLLISCNEVSIDHSFSVTSLKMNNLYTSETNYLNEVSGTIYCNYEDEIYDLTLTFTFIDVNGNEIEHSYYIPYVFISESVDFTFTSQNEISYLSNVKATKEGQIVTNTSSVGNGMLLVIPTVIFFGVLIVSIVFIVKGIKRFKSSGGFTQLFDEISDAGESIGDAFNNVKDELFKDQETRDLESELKKTKLKKEIYKEQIINCGYCGCENKIGHKNCSSCGAPLDSDK